MMFPEKYLIKTSSEFLSEEEFFSNYEFCPPMPSVRFETTDFQRYKYNYDEIFI